MEEAHTLFDDDVARSTLDVPREISPTEVVNRRRTSATLPLISVQGTAVAGGTGGGKNDKAKTAMRPDKFWREVVATWDMDGFQSTKLDIVSNAIQHRSVPNYIRPTIWMLLTDSDKVRNRYPAGHYSFLVTKIYSHQEEYDEVISFINSIEIPTPFKKNAFYSRGNGAVLVRDMLLALSLMVPFIANFDALVHIASNILLRFNGLIGETSSDAVDQSFWLLYSIAKGGYTLWVGEEYTNIDKCIDLAEHLIWKQLPILNAFFTKMRALSPDGADVTADVRGILKKWFVTLYTSSDVPYHLNGRMLDQYMLLGPEVLYRVAVALFIINESNFLKCKGVDEVRSTIQNLASAASSEVILKVAWSIALNDEVLDRMIVHFQRDPEV